MAGNVGRESADEVDEEVPNDPSRTALRLRTAALPCLVVGFVGAVADGTAPIAFTSVFSYVFAAGVVLALASVYLGLYRAGPAGD